MIVLFTDFGADDLYVGQVKARLLQGAPAATAIVDLLHSVPNFDALAGAHLLAAVHRHFPAGTVFFAVIDPGVGSNRAAAVLEADGQWFVGPDNGLLSIVAARAAHARTWRVRWRPDELSTSFHGRDLFAPIAAGIAGGVLEAEWLEPSERLEVAFAADDLARIIYLDHYGNAMTGLRAANVPGSASLEVAGQAIAWARVFSDVAPGTAIWYENSLGLVEIAVNRGSAAARLGLAVGDPVALVCEG
jgi:S-adenosylmethionine hydrolase